MTTYTAAMDRADRAYADLIRALFNAGHHSAAVHQSGGMCMVAQVPLTDDPSGLYPLLLITDADSGMLPAPGTSPRAWLVGLYLDDADDGDLHRTCTGDLNEMVDLVNSLADRVRA